MLLDVSKCTKLLPMCSTNFQPYRALEDHFSFGLPIGKLVEGLVLCLQTSETQSPGPGLWLIAVSVLRWGSRSFPSSVQPFFRLSPWTSSVPGGQKATQHRRGAEGQGPQPASDQRWEPGGSTALQIDNSSPPGGFSQRGVKELKRTQAKGEGHKVGKGTS